MGDGRVIDLRPPTEPSPAEGAGGDDDALVVCVGLSPARTLAVLDALGDAGSLVLARDTEHALRLLGHTEPGAAPSAREPAGPAPGARVHRLGALTVDEDTRRVTWSGTPISLSVKEFDLLCVLVELPGRVHTFADLTRRVWSREYLGDDDSVVSAVKRLRRRLGAGTEGVRVESVRGVGFRLVEDVGPPTQDAPAPGGPTAQGLSTDQSFSTGA